MKENTQPNPEYTSLRFPELTNGSILSASIVLRDIMNHINDDGSVTMPWGNTFYPNPINFTHLDIEQMRKLQLQYARTLFGYMRDFYYPAALGSQSHIFVKQNIEHDIALQYSSTRIYPEILQNAAIMVDEVIQERCLLDFGQHPTRPLKYPEIA